LAPRVRKNRLNIDPNSLLPKLPSPSELKPFPTVAQTIFRGHEGTVRSVSIDPVSIAEADTVFDIPKPNMKKKKFRLVSP